MCFATVRGRIPRIVAISALVLPWATQSSTSASRRVTPKCSGILGWEVVGCSSRIRRSCSDAEVHQIISRPAFRSTMSGGWGG